ncbi:MAG: NAD-dependent epimerase/dehydratase family protein [Planctomycetota bacterium]|nr:NAD-dependent epimerase/dehydratase family protein [Planctomycetota bacterium]
MNVLVTGGGGFLGLYITEQLVARGDHVRVLCRGDYPRLTELGVDCRRADIRDAEAVRSACDGMDAVIHTAAIPGIWGSWKRFHSINTLGTENVIAGCQSASVAKLVYTSSPSVVFDGSAHLNADESQPYATRFLCHYPHSKAFAEQSVRAANGSGLSTVALRPHLIWGPRDNHLIPRLLQRAKSGRLRRVGDGSNWISMSYVENAAAAHLQVLDALSPDSVAAGRAYFINDPQPVVLWDWINDLLGHAGLPPVRKSIPLGVAKCVGAVLEAIYGTLRLASEPPMTRFLALQLATSHTYDISRAVRDFGYHPIVDPGEALRRLIEWLQFKSLGRESCVD